MVKQQMKKAWKLFLQKIKGIGNGLAEDVRSQCYKVKEHPGRTVLLWMAIIVTMLGLAGAIVYEKGHGYYLRSNYMAGAQEQTQANPAVTPQAMEEPEDPEMQAIRENLAKYSQSQAITTDGSVYNILLIGVDRVKKTTQGNSDSMILISINYSKKQISMISLMRDIYVHIPGIGYRKLNAAYANGGGQLLTETVTENFKIQVDRYMAVSFRDMAEIIDAIGSISITFTDKEAQNANKTLNSMLGKLNMSEEEIATYLIAGEGTYECNGYQAVAYARIRKVGNSDYQRTERQREVLSRLIDKIKVMSIDDIDRLANQLLPKITHNIPESEFWGILAKVPSLLTYNLEKDRVPYDGLSRSQGEYLVPSWDETIAKLKETLYTSQERLLTSDPSSTLTLTPTPTLTPVPTLTPTPTLTSTPTLTPTPTETPIPTEIQASVSMPPLIPTSTPAPYVTVEVE